MKVVFRNGEVKRFPDVAYYEITGNLIELLDEHDESYGVIAADVIKYIEVE